MVVLAWCYVEAAKGARRNYEGTNWLHDRLYQLGFTEQAGNFQTTNFNRSGLGGDALQAAARDGSGYNNANNRVIWP